MSENFNLDSYLSQYTNEGLLQRLQFIAEQSPELRKECYERILTELKNRAASLGITNTNLYETISNKLGVAVDHAWIEQINRRANQRLENLQAMTDWKALTSQSSGSRETIMFQVTELAEFFVLRGEYPNALKCYFRLQGVVYNLDIFMNIIKIHAAMGMPSHAQTYVTKAETLSTTPDTSSKLKVVSGLIYLHNGKYKSAADKFIEASKSIGSSFSDVISAEDTCYYAILCALATYDRNELKTQIIDNFATFKNIVESAPNLRDILLNFYNSAYSSCLHLLDKLKNKFILDINLYKHIDLLYSNIRDRALIQYFSPYISVNINTMATAFNCSVSDLEKELSKLIMSDKIQARIDSHNKILYARRTDRKKTTFKNALKMGEEYQNEMAAFILRTNLIQNDFTNPPKIRKKPHQERPHP